MLAPRDLILSQPTRSGRLDGPARGLAKGKDHNGVDHAYSDAYATMFVKRECGQ